MSEVKTICMENHSHDGEVLRQELVTYRKVRGSLVKEKVERVFLETGSVLIVFQALPLLRRIYESKT